METETTIELVSGHTAYVERSYLTSRHFNGRLVRGALSFSKKKELFEAASVSEDAVYNLTRPIKTLRLEVNQAQRRFKSARQQWLRS